MIHSSNKKVRVCFFGTYDKKYSSNKIIIQGLKANDVDVFELNINTRISDLSVSKHLNPLLLLKRIVVKLKLIPLIFNNLSKLTKCDVLFVGYPGHFDLLIGILIAKILGKKLVFYPLIILYITFTEDIELLTTSSWKAKALKLFEKIIYLFPDSIIADIPFQKDLFKRLFHIPDAKLREIPIGADELIYKYFPKKPREVFNVVYYGLFSPLHGVEHIIHAANLLRKHKNIRFLLIGKGKTYETNRRLAKKLRLENVIFYENTTEDTAKELLESADVFLGFMQNSPSVHRVLPNKVYQGLALGKTVITADTAATRAIFEQKKNIYLCKIADARSLAEAILELKKNPSLNRNIAKHGYKLFTTRFSSVAIGKQLKNIFYELLGLYDKEIVPSISIGIPTHEANKSIIKTLHSLYNQQGFEHIDHVLMVVDGNTIKQEIFDKIKHSKLKVIYEHERKGQSTRMNDIFRHLNSDYIILTNDDVILKQNSLSHILTAIATRRNDLLSCQVEPLKPSCFFQKIILTGFMINNVLSKSWRNGDNYLSCNGRGIVLSKRLYKKITIPSKLWNNDSFIYLFAKVNQFQYSTIPQAVFYYKLPLHFEEHMKQSTKFAFSYDENKKYFKHISTYYEVPFLQSLKALFFVFLRNPFYTILYMCLFFYIRIEAGKYNHNPSNTGYWKTDISTKSI